MSGINNYYQKIKKISVLSQEEEVNLVLKIQNGDEQAREIFIKSNLRLVVDIAKDYMMKGVDLDDLIQNGNLGLYDAIKNFDVTRRIKFSTFATKHIKGKITELFKKAHLISRPSKISNKIKKFKETKDSLWKKLEREPSIEEIALKMKITNKEAVEIHERILVKCNIDDMNENEKPHTSKQNFYYNIQDIFPDKKNALLFLKTLDDKERTVIALRYGLNSEKTTHSLKEIADIMNLSKPGVSKIEKEVIKKAKQFSAKQLLKHKNFNLI